MAEVYLARAEGIEGFQKPVAVKLIHGHLTESPEFIEMFLNEARLAAGLDHPNVCNVLDLGEVQGEHYIAMEYIHGRSLRDVLKHAGGARLPMDAALSIIKGACAGLHYVHEHRGPDGRPRHMVHRDVSPSNFMVRFDGGVKLVDFGIAKAVDMSSATRTGTIKGKAAYMSPEQTFGERLDRRSDIYSLGVVMYETTTGRRMFYGDNERAVMNKITDGVFDAPRQVVPGYPEALEAIVMRAVASAPDDRYDTAEAVLLDVEDFARGEGVRLSDSAVKGLMLGFFGEEAQPAVTGEFDLEPDLPTVVQSSSGADPPITVPPDLQLDVDQPPPRRVPWLAAVGLLALGSVGGVLYASRGQSSEDSAKDVAPADGSASETKATVVETPSAEPEPVVPPVATPPPDPPPEPSEPTSEPAKADVPTKSSKRPRKKSRDRRKKSSKPPKRDPIRPL